MHVPHLILKSIESEIKELKLANKTMYGHRFNMINRDYVDY